ncbi:hypothetical protein BJ875DRAFT_448761 [Amylocarpus encephaloides]|uniref:Uncharacterized protein n=1 Tax=Amylocarpus encephaloides TaxID=45428 RepID=A0A9P7YT10_9HELO|nr:hypothetical protein BJ875DRAFT_448761 [Amylocarpus encephaloides]
MSEAKPEFQSDFEEFDTQRPQTKSPMASIAGSVSLGLTTLALLSAIAIVGTSAQALGTYNTTHLGRDYLLPLWPSNFDIRPTTALVACGAVIIVSSAISLVLSFVPELRAIQLKYRGIAFLAPTVGLIAGLVGTSFFYGVNASNTTSSLQSWSCQWSAIDMNIKPHWGTLCRQSKAGLYLMVMMIPLQVIVLSAGAVGVFAAKPRLVVRERKGSPAMS